MEELKHIYIRWSGSQPSRIEKLPGAGSNRCYYRIYDAKGESVIGVVGTSVEENDAFVYLANSFYNKGLSVPNVYAVSEDGLRYLQKDLGSQSLFDAIADGRSKGGHYSEDEKELLRRTISQLPQLQVVGAENLDFSKCYPQPQMDEMNVMFDLNYFKYCFLKTTGIDFHELRLEEDFRRFANDLMDGTHDTFLYRDFQARNVMLDSNGMPYFIDFQGGRRGPLEYDLASFLWQASAHYSKELREELIGEYLTSLKNYRNVNEAEFRNRLNKFVLFRTLQVLGAYGFRGYFEKKKHFIDSIPPAISNLRSLLDEGICTYTYLYKVLDELTSKFSPTENLQVNLSTPNADMKCSVSKYDGNGPLRVRIFSFSYKKGIPQDESGNGGGYVFDCRSTHNPGRYEPYKQLTGLDEPVIKFLEEDGEILTFLESVYKLADAHVARYMERGFTDLMFSFGCTGGQHRSVYSAQHLAEHLHLKFGIEVSVCHREQKIEKVFKRKA